MKRKYILIISYIGILCFTAIGCSSKSTTPVPSTGEPATVLPQTDGSTAVSSADETEAFSTSSMADEAILDEIAGYTPASPLTDQDRILQVLQTLQLREVEWFSRPGWYQQVHGYDSESFGHMVFLTHVIDSNRACQEQFFYYLKDDQIWPFIIRLEDGAMGMYNPLFEGKLRSDTVQPADQSIPCDLGNGASLWVGNEPGDFILHDETLRFQSRQELMDMPGINLEMRAWVETVNDKECFVWETRTTYEHPVSSGSGIYIDPQTNTQEVIAGTDRRIYIEITTGLMLKDEEDLHLLSGKLVDGSDSQPNIYVYYEVLPAEIATAYDQMADDVRKALEE